MDPGQLLSCLSFIASYLPTLLFNNLTLRRGVLTESALALEAVVQAQPDNAEAWRLLGTVQAENDDDQQVGGVPLTVTIGDLRPASKLKFAAEC